MVNGIEAVSIKIKNKMKKINHSEPFVSEEDIEVVKEQVDSHMHANGSKTKEFEDAMCKIIGTKYANATTSGTTALHLALMALNVSKGDEVIIPSYICQSVMNAINYTGAIPVLADIDLDFENKGYNISAKTIKSLITKKTKVIVVAHMFGVPADIDSIRKIAPKIFIIEDCAHSFGAMYKGNRVGGVGDLSIFSFYATKIISTGHGGMVLTSSKKLQERIKDLMKDDKRDEYKIAYNYKLSDIQSALGISQLKKLDYFIKRRKKIAEKYDNSFKNTSFKLFPQPEGSFPFRYIIRLDNKKKLDEIQNKLKEKRIIAEQPIFKPLHQYINLDTSKFINSEKAHDITLSIPLYPALTDREVDYIIKSIKEVLRN